MESSDASMTERLLTQQQLAKPTLDISTALSFMSAIRYVYIVRLDWQPPITAESDDDSSLPPPPLQTTILSAHTSIESANAAAESFLRAGGLGNEGNPVPAKADEDLDIEYDADGCFKAVWEEEGDYGEGLGEVVVVKMELQGAGVQQEQEREDEDGGLSDADEGEIEIIEPPKKRAREA